MNMKKNVNFQKSVNNKKKNQEKSSKAFILYILQCM